MGIDDRVNQVNFLSEKLNSQFGRGIDQKDTLLGINRDTRSSAVVSRIGRFTSMTVTTNYRHAMTGSGSEQYQFAIRRKRHRKINSVKPITPIFVRERIELDNLEQLSLELEDDQLSA